MCLLTIKRRTTREDILALEPEIASKDISVWKVLLLEIKPNSRLRNRYISPYYDFEYKKGEHYYQTEDWCSKSASYQNNQYGLEIESGLHAYINKIFAENDEGKGGYVWRLHASQYYRIYYNKIIVKMTIPKGSRYYLGICGDIVTDNLIWK